MAGDETNIEKDLRLLLKAEFAEFKLALFGELQTKLEGKADRTAVEAVRTDLNQLTIQVGGIIQARELAQARERGIWFALGKGRAAAGWVVAAVVAAADVASHFFR